MDIGKLDKETQLTPGVKLFSKVTYCQERADYTAGGVTFNYPVGLFSGIPNVRVTLILKNLAYANNIILLPIVTVNTATTTTVRVNVGTIGGGISEAVLDDVEVHIFASV